jgi:SAM-dependent methyltransferase
MDRHGGQRCTNPALLVGPDVPAPRPPARPTTPREGTHDSESDWPTRDWTRYRDRRRRRQIAFIDLRAAGGAGLTTTRKIDMTRSDPSPSTALDPTRFSVVDHTADPDFYVRFMEQGHRIPDIVTGRLLSTAMLHLRAGHRVLDLGCGPALEAADLAARIGPRGELVGVDASAAMIAAARRRGDGLNTPTRFEIGSAYELPFQDASFDASRAERVFMHLAQPERALREMRRVTRTGGRVCVVDYDWQSLLIDHPDPSTTETLVRGLVDDLADGVVGRKLRRMFVNAGFPDPEITLHPVRFNHEFNELLFAGYLSRLQADGRLRPDQAQTWWNQLQITVDDQTYFAAVTSVIAAATNSAGIR